jgi:hypothetical protein
MGRVSDHLKGFHKSAMERCNTVSKCVGKLAGMAKASKSDLKPDDDDGLCGTLQKISDVFAAGATYHKAAVEELSKATGDEFSKGASDDLVKRITALENTVIPTTNDLRTAGPPFQRDRVCCATRLRTDCRRPPTGPADPLRT